ncbi:MAG: CBS domain-containing protein [Nitrososphaerales archaeon]
MLPPIEEIKKRRIKLGLSQRKLASYLGVAQSTITKLENRQLNPSYDLVRKAYEIMDSFGSRQIGLAGDIATKKVVSVRDHDPVSSAVEILQKNGFKQLPVTDGGNHFVGSISERSIANRLLKVANSRLLLSKTISEIMDDAFPMIAENTPISVVIQLLQHFQAVLTMNRGRVSGIITNANLLKMMTTEKGE